MKHRSFSFITAMCLSTSTLLKAQEGPPDMVASGAVTIALTQTYQLPTLISKDEEGKDQYDEDPETGKKYPIMTSLRSWTVTDYRVPQTQEDPTRSMEILERGFKQGKARYGNREILLDMLNQDLLDGDTSISGWSIVGMYNEITTDVDGTEASLPSGLPMPFLVARKVRSRDNVSIVNVPITLSAVTVWSQAGRLVNTESTRYVYDRESESYTPLEPVYSVSLTNGTTHLGKGQLVMGEDEASAMHGTVTGSTRVSARGYSWVEEIFDDNGNTKMVTMNGRYFVNLPGQLRIANIAAFTADEDPEYSYFTSGSVSVAPAVAVLRSSFAPEAP
jgi:hypothetical protein